MIVKKFGIDFYSKGGALTLNSSEVSDNGYLNIIQEKTHSDGWTIKGKISEDYYYWVNEFEAIHPQFGRVFGNFENEVFADSEEGFNDFYEKHTPEVWDYYDI